MEHGEHGHAVALGQVAQELHDSDLVTQVQMDGRLIEQQQPRILGNGHCQHGQLALAERQLAHVAPSQMADADAFDGSIDPVPIHLTRAEQRVLMRNTAQRDKLLDAHREGHHGLAGHDGDRPRQSGAFDVRQALAVDEHLARARLDEPGHAAQERCLAGAVGADQGEPLAGREGQVDVVEHAPRPVVERQAAQLEGSAAHSS